MNFKRLWIEYDRSITTEEKEKTVISDCRPVDGDKTLIADRKIQELISDGWNIVGITPISGSLNIINGHGVNTYMTYTTGIEVFMTR